MDSPLAMSTPAVGPPGVLTNLSASSVRPGAIGSSLYFGSANTRATYQPTLAQATALLRSGEISLRINPSYGAGDADDSRHTFVVIGDLGNPPALLFEESDALSLTYIDANWVSHSVQTRWRQPVFGAGAFTQLTARWNSTAADSMQLFVNGVRVDTGGAGPYATGSARSAAVTVGADNYGGYGASANLDDLRISSK